MFGFVDSEKKRNDLEQAIHDLHEEMATFTGDTDEYTRMADNLTKLYKLREMNNPRWQPSADSVLSAFTSIAGIAMIVNFERTGVITTKALGLIPKLIK